MVLINPDTVEQAQPNQEVIKDELSAAAVLDLEPLDKLKNDKIDIKCRVQDTPHSGKGMFAIEDITPGTIILREKPLIVMPDKVFSNDDPDYIEEWLEKRLNKLSAAQRQEFYDLADSRSHDGEKTILGIFYTNDMTYIDESAALFPTMARVNHACRPNADFICRPQLGVQDLVATRFIAKGQEIYISYLPAYAEGSAPRSIRQEYTREWYGFQCTCSECSLNLKEKTRCKISKLHDKSLEKLSLTEIHELIEKLIQIDCKLPHQNRVCQLGFEKALLDNDWNKAVQFFAAGYSNHAILNTDENQWNFVINSMPVCINNQLYLFPN